MTAGETGDGAIASASQGYPARSARAGSIRVARRAGRYAATSGVSRATSDQGCWSRVPSGGADGVYAISSAPPCGKWRRTE